ncbi:MAG: SulP family inorganic anion transporter [Sporocytophaga sp.]|uniref:SulP family inorganic anion transporter n=1 Tax=Sporocytophaga sp. TaxID=2231183 RepID=UPI001B14E81A|nr:SulP family inorganic anion transporter [Sporocytophaga sp.]MBO9700891.1 SulP family inorganic anion transporter [Sporocytophaga sp.]
MGLLNNLSKQIFANLKYDIPSGLVVFVVALPLCLGIALASGAPLFSGLIAGMVGGLVVALLSGAALSVSGPAAGLTVIVLNAITEVGYNAFLLGVVIAGVLQIILGFIKAGTISLFFPSSVIKGMLAAIGIILILKQIPHAIGYDVDYEGDFSFDQFDKENTFTELMRAYESLNKGAIIISGLSLLIMIFWDRIARGFLKSIPAPLIVVVVGSLLNILFAENVPVLVLEKEHLVAIPEIKGLASLTKLVIFPAFNEIWNLKVWRIGLTLAVVASLETLLSIEAVDKLDPLKRHTPTNRELKAQGVGNILSGIIGGLPMTSVIVRGTANVTAGARSKFSSFYHGLLLLLCVVFLHKILIKIPLAALAAILLVIGYKLTSIGLYKNIFKNGVEQFVPFILTILAIVLTDLLKGIIVGICIAVVFILRRNLKLAYSCSMKESEDTKVMRLDLAEEVSFLNKANIMTMLREIPDYSKVIIDGSHAKYIDYDVIEILNDYKVTAKTRGIDLQMENIKESYDIGYKNGK